MWNNRFWEKKIDTIVFLVYFCNFYLLIYGTGISSRISYFKANDCIIGFKKCEGDLKYIWKLTKVYMKTLLKSSYANFIFILLSPIQFFKNDFYLIIWKIVFNVIKIINLLLKRIIKSFDYLTVIMKRTIYPINWSIFNITKKFRKNHENWIFQYQWKLNKTIYFYKSWSRI